MNSSLGEDDDSDTPLMNYILRNPRHKDKRAANVNILLKTSLRRPPLNSKYVGDKKAKSKGKHKKIVVQEEDENDTEMDQQIRQDPNDPNKWEIVQVAPMDIEKSVSITVVHKKALRTPCKCPYCKEGGKYVDTNNGRKKLHICAICKHTYGKSSHLNAHVMKHSGKRPYPCSLCNKRFTRSDEIKRHMRTHTGEKSHKCGQCGKEFTRSDHLSKHIKIHLRQKGKGQKSDIVLQSAEFDELHQDEMKSEYYEYNEDTGDACFPIDTIKEELIVEPIIMNIQMS